MSTIYWKFKNSKTEFSSITFDSTHVSIIDLKRAIIRQKKLQQNGGQAFDLRITNAHTGVEYSDETGPIPRNLAVIVRRLPAMAKHVRKLFQPLTNNTVIATADNISGKSISEKLTEEFGAPIFSDPIKSNPSNPNNNNYYSSDVSAVQSETQRIIDMQNKCSTSSNSNSNSNTSNNSRNRMPMRNNNMRNSNNDGQKQSYRMQRGDPPPGYICHRCHISGHWIQDCPTNGDPKYDKKNRSRMNNNLPVPKPATPTNVSGSTSDATSIPTQQVIVGNKCYQIPTNVYESFNGDTNKIKAYIEISSGITNSFSQSNRSQDNLHGNYSRYKCEICNSFYVDARFTPCCRMSYCNECIRQKISPYNPSIIKCPSCEDEFDSEKLDTSKNTKLQEKVDKIVKEQKKLNKLMLNNNKTSNNNNIINLNPNNNNNAPNPNNNNPSNPNPNQVGGGTIKIQNPSSNITNTIHIPKPVITTTNIRPTVILKQSPPSHNTSNNTYLLHNSSRNTNNIPNISITPSVINTNTNTNTSNINKTPPSSSAIQIDTSRFEPPVMNINNNDLNVICLNCNERGHKFKNCPKRINTSTNTNPIKPDNSGNSSSSSNSDDQSDNIGITLSSDLSHKQQQQQQQAPSMTVNVANINITNTNAPKVINNNNKSSSNNNNRSSSNNNNNQSSRGLPQVQLINNSLNAINNISNMSNLNNLNNLNALNMANINMRNKLLNPLPSAGLNNLLLNAAYHNAQRSHLGVTPRLISTPNAALIQSALALQRLTTSNNPINPHLATLLQQQSLLTQQATLNRFRNHNSLNRNILNNYPLLNQMLLNNKNNNNNNAILQQQNTNNNTNLLSSVTNLNNNNNSNQSRSINNININNSNQSTLNNNNNNNNSNQSLNNLNPEIITELTRKLKENKSNPTGLASALKNMFNKLGATNPAQQQLLLKQLINIHNNNNNNNNNNNTNNNTLLSDSTSLSPDSINKHKKKSSRSKKKKDKKSKRRDRDKSSKRSKSRHKSSKRDKNRDKKHKYEKDRNSKHKNKSKNKDNNNNKTSSDFPDPDENINPDTNNNKDNNNNNPSEIIHVDVSNPKKRKLPPAPLPAAQPDFSVSPPPKKKQKLSKNNDDNIPEPSI